MRSNLTVNLLLASVLLVGCAQADVSYSVSQGTGNSGLSATADFFVTCSATCNLDILLTDNLAGSSIGVSQAISGVSFDLTTTVAGMLVQNITNGSGGAVTTVTDTGTLGSTNTPTHWTDSASGNLYTLTTIGNGTPIDLIIGAGAGSGTGSGFNGAHSPNFEGPVLFQISGITGLNAATGVSNVSILFGTAPDTTLASSSCTTGSGSSGSCNNANLGNSPVPEPVSFLLAVGGLAGLAFVRRRFLSQN